jgi:hypothetical protein
METIIESIKAITETVEAAFPNANIMNKDRKKGYERPCIYIDVEGGSDDLSEDFIQQTHNIAVYYFADSINKGFLELLKIRNQFTNLLRKRINVDGDFFIHAENINYDISSLDMALKVTFDITTAQIPDDTDESEYIENLNLNIKKE